MITLHPPQFYIHLPVSGSKRLGGRRKRLGRGCRSGGSTGGGTDERVPGFTCGTDERVSGFAWPTKSRSGIVSVVTCDDRSSVGIVAGASTAALGIGSDCSGDDRDC